VNLREEIETVRSKGLAVTTAEPEMDSRGVRGRIRTPTRTCVAICNDRS
jgi:hypothetical protein